MTRALRSALLACLVLAACGGEDREAAPSPTDGALEAAAPAAPPPPPAPSLSPAPAEGWISDSRTYPLIGKSVPEFSADLPDGGALTRDMLRDRWTILGFWGLWSADSLADVRYMTALASAVGQDPELDFIGVHTPPVPVSSGPAFGVYDSLEHGLSDQGGVWTTAVDADGSVAAAFQTTGPPVYLLIGPDLTIEAWRAALHDTPEDGIKPVIAGVAEIRRQISAP